MSIKLITIYTCMPILLLINHYYINSCIASILSLSLSPLPYAPACPCRPSAS